MERVDLLKKKNTTNNLNNMFKENKTKQEAHGPHRSVEKPAQINKTWVPFTQECFVSSLVEIYPVVLEKKILKSMYFRYFLVISPW